MLRKSFYPPFFQGAPESSYRHYVRVKRPLQSILKSLRLIDQQNDKAASDDFARVRDAWSTFNLKKPDPFKHWKERYTLLPWDERNRRTRPEVESDYHRPFYYCAPLLLQKLKIKCSAALEKIPSNFEEYPLGLISYTETIFLPVKKPFANTIIFYRQISLRRKKLQFFAQKSKLNAFHGERQSILHGKMGNSPGANKKDFRSSFMKRSLWLGEHAGTKLTPIDLERGLKFFRQKKDSPPSLKKARTSGLLFSGLEVQT